MKTEILGIQFDNLSFAESLETIEKLFSTGGGTVVTANPELILAAKENPGLRKAVNTASLVTPDGVGDLFAAKIMDRPLKERVTGSDLVPALLKNLAARNGSVFLYGARPGVALRAVCRLRQSYPGLRILGSENGYINDETSLLSVLKKERPDLLLLGLGSPRQEFWMEQHSSELPGTVVIGVGGLLDVLAGDIKRAPAWMCDNNLEWLFRLIQEPRRISRMVKLPGVLVLALQEKYKEKKTAKK